MTDPAGRVTSVPAGRIGDTRTVQTRGDATAVLTAATRKRFDDALTVLLRLPAPETAPPGRSKSD